MSLIEHRPAGSHRLRPAPGRRPREGDGRGPRTPTSTSPDDVAYGALVTSTIAKGRVTRRRRRTRSWNAPTSLAVIWPRQRARGCPAATTPSSPSCRPTTSSYFGQIVAVVVADDPRGGDRCGAEDLVTVEYERVDHDVALRTDHPRLYAPKVVNPNFDTDSAHRRRRRARSPPQPVAVDVTYTTPQEHNNPMEPHATVAWWDGGRLTMHDSIQGIAPGPGGGRGHVRRSTRPTSTSCIPTSAAGSARKGLVRPHAIATALAAKVVGRPVKLAVTRRQMFSLTGYRTPTIQRLRLGATADGDAHRDQPRGLGADLDDARVRRADRRRHPPPLRRAEPAHHPPPRRPRRPHAELDARPRRGARRVRPGVRDGRARRRARLDPVELRIRNEPAVDPESGLPVLVAPPRRLPPPGRRPVRVGRPASARPAPRPAAGSSGLASRRRSTRRGRSRRRAPAPPFGPDGRWLIEIDAADIGTGARTALARLRRRARGRSPRTDRPADRRQRPAHRR